jgi:hypothetical protein
MRIARIDNLEREDHLYTDGEPQWRYDRRQIVLVENDYDFETNNTTDVSSIENWIKYDFLLPDYQCLQKSIRLEGLKKGWTNCTTAEKDILIDYYAYMDKGDGVNDYRKIVHLITTRGYSTQEAANYLINKWHDHFRRFKADCQYRWDETVKIVISYLSMSDSAALFDITNSMVTDYLTAARQGLGYGDSRPGIMNYVTSTSIFEGNGLRETGYILKKGTWDTFIKDISDMLVCSYFWYDIVDLYYPDPIGLSASVNGTSSQLTWQSENVGWGYELEWDSDTFDWGSGNKLSGTISSKNMSVDITDLSIGMTYSFYIKEKIGNYSIVGPFIFNT